MRIIPSYEELELLTEAEGFKAIRVVHYMKQCNTLLLNIETQQVLDKRRDRMIRKVRNMYLIRCE